MEKELYAKLVCEMTRLMLYDDEGLYIDKQNKSFVIQAMPYVALKNVIKHYKPSDREVLKIARKFEAYSHHH